jgi:16S rRNA (cytosine1407-C5)-methyltransferase
MWPEHKLGPLISLQRELLRKAASLLAPGGRLLYSTCTTNPGENLEQVEWARTELGLSSAPLRAVPGFESSQELCEAGEGCLQVHAEAGEGQGFFFAALARPPSEGSKGFPEPVAAWEPSGRLLYPRDFVGLEQAAWDRLPPGELREFSGRVMFLPRQATFLPRSLRWQGFELGRLQGKTPRLNPRLRLLLPEYAKGHGLNIEDVGELTRLLQGQSLALPADASGSRGRIGLYWRGLPLGWATLKGHRCLWSSR